MLSNYIFTNLGFALSVASALVFFITGWLYLDSWKVEKKIKNDLVRSIGFFLLAAVSITHASLLEIPVLNFSLQVVQVVALCLVAGSLVVEPILRTPPKGLAIILPFAMLTNLLVPLTTVLLFEIAFLYFRKSTIGNVKQIKPAALAFFFLALAELINVSFFWQGTTNPFWSQILALYGPVWIIVCTVKFIGLALLARWTWGYFRFQIGTQLFIIAVSASVGFFFVTTVSFTFLLLHNFENDALSHLKTDVRVVQYAIERLQKEALSSATAVAENPEVKNAFNRNNTNNLYNLTSNLMLSYNTNFLSVINNTGKVIMRGEDKDAVGDVLTSDPTVKSALGGQRLATVVSLEGAVAPRIQIKASVPIYNNSKVQGAISTGFWIDSAFVDGIKNMTGLDTTIFGGNTRAATTFVAPDGKTRFVGSLETNSAVLKTVLEKEEIFVGTSSIFNKPYYTAYAPLITYPNKVIGMIFVGKLQTELSETAQKSIQLTFIGSIILMILSLVPIYYISRYIKGNIKA
jgi:hypothetical protein